MRQPTQSQRVKWSETEIECETHFADRGHERSRVPAGRHEAASQSERLPMILWFMIL